MGVLAAAALDDGASYLWVPCCIDVKWYALASEHINLLAWLPIPSEFV